jgi:N-acetylneuraminic acid mutarotase
LINKLFKLNFCLLFLFFGLKPLCSAVPLLMTYHGHVLADGRPFEGDGQFKFAVVNQGGTTLWRNDGESTNGEPAKSIEIKVVHGVFAVMLGDVSVTNMAALKPGLFDQEQIFIRTWFGEDNGSFVQLKPDSQVTSVGFAINALKAKTVDELPDGIVTETALGEGLREVIELNSAKTGITPNQETAIAANTAKIYVLEQATSLSGLNGVFASTNLHENGYRKIHSFPSDSWSSFTAANEPTGRYGHVSAWDGSNMIIWGGLIGTEAYIRTGAAYNPATTSWSEITPINAPSARSSHSAVWSGSELIVWSGQGSNGLVSSGARYRLSDRSWHPMVSNNVPSARYGNAAVWTSTRMLIWGGRNNNGILNDGALYDPATDTWATLSLGGDVIAARYWGTAILAEDKVLIWGGKGITGALGDGGVIPLSDGVPLAGSLGGGYIPIATTGSPAPRSRHTAIWTGDRMIIWGGISSQSQFYSDGFMYDPVGKSWTPISSVNAPTARELHSAVWTGTEMVIIAGRGGAGALSDAHAYDPVSDRWRQLSGNVGARYGSTAVWTGAQVIVFGGENGQQPLSRPMKLDPTPTMNLFIKE